MNPEEAGEIVLRGKHWVQCTQCRGAGVIHHSPLTTRAAFLGGDTSDCDLCQTKGYLFPDQAREAYESLNLPLPPKPPSDMERYSKTMHQVQDSIKERLQGYIGQVGVTKEQMIEGITQVLDMHIPESERVITVEVDPGDPTRVHVSINKGGKQ